MTYWNGTGWEADTAADPPRPKRARRILAATTEATLITLLIFGLVAGTALGAKGGNGKGGGGKPSAGTGTITLVLMDSTDGLAHFGQRVSFAVTTSATDMPYVHLQCRQNGVPVLDGWQGFFDTALGNQWFYLGPTPAWQSGDADCTASLEKYSPKGWQQLASTSFHTSP